MSPKIRNKWILALDKRYPDLKDFMPLGIEHLESIYNEFKANGLADSKFDSQLELDTGYSYHHGMSEVLLSDRLLRDGFKLSSRDSGPDFKATKDNRTYWFEVITPEPMNGIEKHNLDTSNRLNPTGVGSENLSTWQLWRITAAIKEKKEKFEKYINSEHFEVKESDFCIIVINDSLLEPFDLPMYGLTQEVTHGVSGLPLAAEAVYGIGHCYWEDKETPSVLLRRKRNKVLNKNGSPIKLNGFLNDSLAIISGVFCLTLREDYGLTCLFSTNKANSGVYLENQFANTKIKNSDLSAKFMNHEYIEAFLSPTEVSKNHNNMVHTIYGQKIDFINYLRSEQFRNYAKKKHEEEMNGV